jgi:hypothetical protein
MWRRFNVLGLAMHCGMRRAGDGYHPQSVARILQQAFDDTASPLCNANVCVILRCVPLLGAGMHDMTW